MKLFILVLTFLFSGCATNDYRYYASSQVSIAASKASVETARYQALSKIANTSQDTVSKVAALMAIAMSAPAQGQPSHALNAPPPNEALQWASILVPSLTQVWGITKNAQVAIRSSDNARDVAISTNATFAGMGQSISATAAAGTASNKDIALASGTTMLGIASLIQAPAANVSTVTTITGDGIVGDGTMTKSPVTTTSTANPVTTSTTTNANPVTTTTTNPTPVVVDGKVCTVNPTTGVLICL